MANSPPPFNEITGTSAIVGKYNQQENIANVDGNARPGQLIVDLDTDPPQLYIGNNNGNISLVASGGGNASLPLSNGTSVFNIPVASGNVTITSNGSYTWNFDKTGNLSLPGNMNITGNIIPSSNITYDLGNNTNRFRDLYLANSTIYIGDQTISANATNVIFSGILNGNADGLTSIPAANLTGNAGSNFTANYSNFAGNLINGTSNVDIATSGGNVITSVAGTTRLSVNTGGANITGALSVSGNANVGNIGAAAGVFTGVVSSTGNINGLNLNTGGILNVTGTSDSSIAGNVNMNGKWLNNIGYAVNNTDAASKQYVDTLVSTGISYHQPVNAATTTTLATSTGGTTAYNSPNGAANGIGAYISTTGSYTVIDDVNIATIGRRILVKNEANATWNGIYTYSNSTAITRATDADEYGSDSTEQISINDYFFVQAGTTNGGSAFVVSAPDGTITFGTSNITFATFSTSQTYTGGTGITVTGTVISANASQTQVTSVGTLTTLSVSGNSNIGNIGTGGLVTATGNITGGNLVTGGVLSATGNANVGNIGAVAGVFTGTLSAIGNSNVGNIGAASGVFTTVAGTLTTQAQPNITSTGTLSSVSVTGVSTLGAVGNVRITGGTSGYYLQTNGSGVLSWAAVPSGNGISNGTSNVSIPTINGNVTVTSAGNTTLTVTDTGANITGTLSVSGNSNVGNIGATNIVGTLSTASQPNITSVGNLPYLQVSNSANADGVIRQTSSGNIVFSTGTPNLATYQLTTQYHPNASTSYPADRYVRSRGNVTTPATAVSGDRILGRTGYLYNGTTNVSSVSETWTGVGTVNSNSNASWTGGQWNITTGNPQGDTSNSTALSSQNSLVFNNSGTLSITPGTAPNSSLDQSTSSILITNYGSSTTNLAQVGGLNFQRARGNRDSVQNIQAGDQIGRSVFIGYSNGAYQSSNVAQIRSQVSSSYTDNDTVIPQDIVIQAISNVAGTATLATTTFYGNRLVSLPGNLNVSGVSNLGAVGNVTITGGSNGQVLTTNGSGGLSFVSISSSSISNGNSNVSIPSANGNVNISAVGNANIVVVTGTGANITGTLSVSGNSNVGNIGAVAGVFTGTLSSTGNANVGNLGTGGLITATGNITGANLVGPLANGNSNVSITTNANISLFVAGNATARTVFTTTGANVAGTISVSGNSNVGNLGTGGLVTATGNITSSAFLVGANLSVTANATVGNLLGRLANGTSNVGIPAINGNVNISAAGVANVIVVTGTGANVTGNLNVSNNTTLANLTVTGTLNAGDITVSSISNGTSNVDVIGASGNVTTSVAGNANIFVVTGLGANVNGTFSVSGNANIATANMKMAGGTNGYFLQTDGTGNLTWAAGTTTPPDAGAGGANTQIQFNDATVPNGAAGFTFDKVSNAVNMPGALTVTGIINGNTLASGNSNIAITANSNIAMTVAGTSNVVVVTSTGANIAGTLSVSGNSNVGNLGATGVFATTLSSTGNSNVGNLGTGGLITVTGNANVGNLNTGGLITATGNVRGGNLVTGGVLSVTGNANVGNLGTGGLITVTGNIGGGNINTGGLITATGNISGGNINTANTVTASRLISNVATGTAPFTVTSTTQVANLNVATAGTAGTVTTNAQPNITSVGTLASLSVTANANIGNIGTGTLTVTGVSALGAVGNVTITGGSNGQVLSTDGSGVLSFVSISSSSISNGNSNVNIPSANGNVNISSEGNANILVVTGTGANVSGTLSVTGNTIVGNLTTGGAGGNIANANVISANTFIALANFSGNTNGFTLGYLNVPQVAASNATLGLTDAGKHYYSTTAGNFTLTIPANNAVAFDTGTEISIVVQAAGNILVNAASGVTLYQAGNSTAANRVVGAYGFATLLKVDANTWFINGTGIV